MKSINVENINVETVSEMSMAELGDLISLMKKKEKAHEELPSEVLRAIGIRLWTRWKQRLEEERRKQVCKLVSDGF